MKKLSTLALIALFIPFTAQADDAATATTSPAAATATTAPAAAAPTTPAGVPKVAGTPAAAQKTATAPATPQQMATMSQQEKMRECNKQATGKKGDERKLFMKTCLSRKPV